MVEQTTAASRMLADQSEELFGLVSRFRVSGSATEGGRAPAPAQVARAARSIGNAALADDDWTEF
jgi:hypothetical protein